VSKANTLAKQGGYHSVASRRDGDYIGFTKVRLDDVNGIELRVATTTASWADVKHSAIEVRVDHPGGQLLGTVRFGPTGGLQDFALAGAGLHEVNGHGAHDLYLVFRDAGLYLDTVRLTRESGNGGHR
jgi:beta-glucosidase